VIIYAGTNGFLDDMAVADCLPFEKGLYDFMDSSYPALGKQILEKKQFDDPLRAEVKKVLDEFIFDTSRCMFCALCQEACPTSCLELTQDFELATYSRAGFVWNREMLEQGRETVKYTR